MGFSLLAMMLRVSMVFVVGIQNSFYVSRMISLVLKLLILLLAEGAIAPCLMIRRDRYKYIYSEPDPEQLFDLVADPNELHNLASQPEYETLRRVFKAEVEARWQLQTLHQSVINSQRRRRMGLDRR